MNELIKQRRSPVIFSPRKVEVSQIETIIDAARWAPSSFNQQPWRFIYALREEKEAWERMFGLLAPGNQEWVHYHVPVLIMSIAEMVPAGRDRANAYAWHDVGLATGNLFLQAVSMGLSVHPMGGFDREKSVELLGIPEPFQPVAMMALGYAGEPDVQPASIVERDRKERSRNPMNTVLFRGSWGNS